MFKRTVKEDHDFNEFQQQREKVIQHNSLGFGGMASCCTNALFREASFCAVPRMLPPPWVLPNHGSDSINKSTHEPFYPELTAATHIINRNKRLVTPPPPPPRASSARASYMTAELFLDSREEKFGRQAGRAAQQGARAARYRGKASGKDRCRNIEAIVGKARCGMSVR